MGIIAFLLVTTWMQESHASAEARYTRADALTGAQQIIGQADFGGAAGERARADGFAGTVVRLAQATPDDAEDLRKRLDLEHHRAELLAHQLSITRHLEMLLTLQQGRAEAARLKAFSGSDHTELQSYVGQEHDRLRREAESGAAELCRILPGNQVDLSEQASVELRTSLQQERDRTARLEQDLAAAKRDGAVRATPVAKTNETASQVEGGTESNAAELKKSLQLEQEHAAQMEKDLAAARHSVETQTALAAQASEDARQSKAAAESDAAGLTKSLAQEREHAAQLEKDLAAAQHNVETQTALAAQASEDARQTKAAAESSASEQAKSRAQEREHAAQLEKDLAAAQHNIETQTALAAQAGEDARRAKAAAESSASEQAKSLAQEREHAAQLEKDLTAARRNVETQTALAAQASEDARQTKAAAESNASEQAKSLAQEREHAAQLEKDLAAARSDVETQLTLASKAAEEASQLKQVSDQGSGSGELKQSLQKEHERAEALAKDLSAAHATIYAYEAQTREASDQAAKSQQGGKNDTVALRQSLQQEQERAGKLERDLAAARHDVEMQTALAARANEDAARSKDAAQNGSAQLKRSLQNEHDRAEALVQNLSMVHTAIYTYEVQARMASDQAVTRAQSAASSAAELRNSLQQVQARAAQLQQELASARHDLETQTALAAKASAEGARLKQATDNSSAEYLKSLQQERDKTARLELELASERKTKDVLSAVAAMPVARTTQDRPPATSAIKPIAVNQTPAAAARGDAKPDPVNVAEVARLVARASVLLEQGDIGSARTVLERAAETGNAQASFALAESYDPLILRKWGAYGTLGDVAKARDLYARAQAGGIKEAGERFDALRR